MNQALIKIAEKASNAWGGTSEYHQASEIIDMLVAEIKACAESNWIPVNERLPEYTNDYNVVCEIGSMMGGYTTVRTYRFERIQGKEPQWKIPDRFDEVVHITHWRPLPEPSKEGE